jgi:prophage regulatory protein
MHEQNNVGFLRLPQIIAEYIPVSKATFWRRVQDGTYPRPVKLSANCSAWRKSDIEELAISLGRAS